MSYTPSPWQTFFLWRLLAAGGGEFLKNKQPKFEPKHRKPLEEAGLIEVEQRKESPEKKGARASMYVALSDRGWLWAANHLDAELPKTQFAVPILRCILTRLKDHLARHEVALADFICGGPDVDAEPTVEGKDLRSRLLAAYSQLTGGRANVRVRLADLRGLLVDIPRDSVDDLLRQLERDEVAALYPLDNPREIGESDEAAALANSAGHKRHIVYIEG